MFHRCVCATVGRILLDHVQREEKPASLKVEERRKERHHLSFTITTPHRSPAPPHEDHGLTLSIHLKCLECCGVSLDFAECVYT